MAIQKDFSLASGITVTGAYWKIFQFSYSKLLDVTSIGVLIYASSSSVSEGKEHIEPPIFFKLEKTSTNQFLSLEAVKNSGKDYISQAYLYLLSLDEFKGALSV